MTHVHMYTIGHHSCNRADSEHDSSPQVYDYVQCQMKESMWSLLLLSWLLYNIVDSGHFLIIIIIDIVNCLIITININNVVDLQV